jgi:hypothetical protein
MWDAEPIDSADPSGKPPPNKIQANGKGRF